jgi:PPIC-type PPIASE domain
MLTKPVAGCLDRWKFNDEYSEKNWPKNFKDMNRLAIMNLLKEPLLHFLLIGAALFLLFGWKGNPTVLPGGQSGAPEAKIAISRDAINQLTTQFRKTWQRPPTQEEVTSLIEELVRNEIYYREAVAIGLDRDDDVLKRRLRQKMEFILEDISSRAEPSDTDLVVFMKKHPDKYLVDPQLLFRQVYVNDDKRGKKAESDARGILAQLTTGTDPDTVGDTFLLEPSTRLSPLWDISKQYGEQFSKGLLRLQTGKWAGPVRSGFGLHLVFVEQRIGGHLPELKEVREAVKRDWTFDRQKELKDAAYAKLRERYAVTVEGPMAATAADTKGVTR